MPTMDHHDEFTVRSTCTPAQAFAYVADLRRAEEWFARDLRIDLAGGGDPLELGTTYDVRLPGPIRPIAFEVVEVEPPFRIAWVTDLDPTLHGCDAFTIEPRRRGCAIRYTTDFLLRGTAALAWPLGGRALLHRVLERSARRLTAHLPVPVGALAAA